MYITQYNIFDALEGIPYRALIQSETPFHFQRDYLLSAGDCPDDPEKLYICDFETLPGLRCEAPEEVCILCAGDLDAIEAFAREHPLNLIAVSSEVSLIRILNLIHEAFSKLLKWSYKVNSDIASQEDFQALVALSRGVFGDNPLLLVSASYNILAASTLDAGGSEKLQPILDLGYFP